MGDGGVGAGAASEALGTTEIKTNINQLVNQDKVVIFSKTSCPYCFDAKEVFDKIGQKYTVVELNNHPQGPQVQDALKEMTGARTVPRVFVNGQCIGGGSDTVNMYKTGNLEKILSKETILSETQ
jgi:glutaredoxin 3